MPLFKIIRIDTNTKVFIWQIKETLAVLKKELNLTVNAKAKYKKIKHLQHKKQFLATQQLLKLAGYTSAHLHYKNSGKPYLDTEQYISISHSNTFAVFAIATKPVGVDIEMPQEKLKRVAQKFINSTADCIPSDLEIIQLTKLWTAKEAVYKLLDLKGLSFKQHIAVCTSKQEVQASVSFLNKEYGFNIYYFSIENCILALAK